MRRHLPIITVMFCQALLAGIVMLLYFETRPAFVVAYRDYPGHIPWHALIALSSWYLPGLVVLALALDVVALAMRKRSTKYAALGMGLILPAFGLALAVDGIFMPLFQVAPAP